MQSAKIEQPKFFLLQRRDITGSYIRSFSALDDNIVIKVLLGAILEQCILDKSESDIDFLLNYILVLRTRFQEKKYYDLEVISTEAFHK